MERVRNTIDDPPDGSVCSVRNKKPRMSESAMLVTQFLFAVVLEMTCNSDTVINKMFLLTESIHRQDGR